MPKVTATPRSTRKRADTLIRSGKLAEAATLYAAACKDHPDNATLWLAFARLHRKLGHHQESEACIRRVLTIQPGNYEALVEYGVALQLQGQLDAAISAWHRALDHNPNIAEAHYLIATALLSKGQTDSAATHYRRTIELCPTHIEALNNLSAVLTNQGRIGESMALLERALQVQPDAYHMSINLARARLFTGDAEAALKILHKVTQRYPDAAEAHSKYLLCTNYVADPDPAKLFAAHRQWGERHAKQATHYSSFDNPAATERRLRIGYLSPDFKSHSVASFIEPLLAHHDRKRFEITCYADVANPDDTTRRLAALAEHWCPVAELSHDRLCEKIHADGIDILVDLAGHTANNRLPVFACKPAPVAVSYLGYPNTTGLDTIDYRFTDAIADPPGVADNYHTEQLLRLPDGFLCYQPPDDAPGPLMRDRQSPDDIVFGSFNNLAKMTPEVITTWSRLLATTDASRLLLKNASAADPYTRTRLTAMFSEQGIDEERVQFLGHAASRSEHLGMYNQIDVALDPFPYNGTTTTCEALWMGVPVVTLRGNVHASRVSASLLSRLGLEQLVATDADDYIRIAAGLGEEGTQLVTMRRELRARMQRSSVCDAQLHTRNIEVAYSDIWRRYCCSAKI